MLVQLQVPIVVVCTISFCVATFAILCRWCARALTKKRWQADDYLMLVAYLATCGVLISAIAFVSDQHYGVHLQDVPLSERQRVNKHPVSRFILTSLSLVANVFCNLSITQLYTTLFPHRRFRICCRILLVVTSCYGIAFFVVQFFSCPRPKNFDTAMAAKCMQSVKTIWVAASVMGVCIDFANVLLPMPILWGLHVELGKKIRLTLLFGLGFFIVTLSAVRIYLYRHMDMYDWTYHTGRIVLFNGPEPALGILAGCLPIMSPCMRFASNKIKSTLRSSRETSEQQLPRDIDGHRPPTIGQVKRFSLKAVGMGSQASVGFERLRGDAVPLTSVAAGVVGEEKLARMDEADQFPPR